jgi:3',5'-cyclic AMP phosphodiesterase CpdA
LQRNQLGKLLRVDPGIPARVSTAKMEMILHRHWYSQGYKSYWSGRWSAQSVPAAIASDANS